MTDKTFVWPIILVGTALLTGSALLLFLVQPASETAPSAGPAENEAPRRQTSGGGFGAADFTSSGIAMASVVSGAVGNAEIDEMDEAEQPWEAAINRLLDSDDENNKVAAELAALAPTMPLEGQVEAIQHMVNLLDDEQYALAQNMLLNPSLHPDLREVIFSDTLDRPNSVKLPVLVGLLGIYGHPLRSDAHSNLQLALGSDLGDNPVAWSKPVEAFLAREAAEEAGAEADVDASEDNR